MAKSNNGNSKGNGNKPTTSTINGTDGNDFLYGTTNDDIINSGKGDDIISAGAGSDTVNAGEGSDVIIHNVNDNAGSKDFYDGGSGNDTLQLVVTGDQYTQLQAAITAFNSSDKSQIFDFSNYIKNMNLKVVNIEHITFEISDVSTNGANLSGTKFDTHIVGTPGEDHLFGTDGNDSIVAAAGDDHVISGKGDDRIVTAAGDDCVNAGAGNDVVVNSAGADTIVHFIDENVGFHDYYQDSGTSVQNAGQDMLVLVFSDADFAKIGALITQMEADFAAAKKNGVVFDFSQYNSAFSLLIGSTKTINIDVKGVEHLEIINATEAQARADEGEICYGPPTHVNHAPVAVPDNFVMNEDDAFSGTNHTFFLGDKLSNDSDPDGTNPSLVSIQNVQINTSHADSSFNTICLSL